MSSHASLDAAASERKARLAKLKSLKRKQSDADTDGPVSTADDDAAAVAARNSHLSGRNYDIAARGPKLGFEHNPSQDKDTAERRALALAETVQAEAVQDQDDKPLDLFKLQPRRPNWDLKRDVEKRMEGLNVQTENAIAKLVRERIAVQKRTAQNQDHTHRTDEEASGFGGEELITVLHAKEQEEQEEEQRERAEDEEEGNSVEDGFT